MVRQNHGRLYAFGSSRVVKQVTRHHFATAIYGQSYEAIERQLPFPIVNYSTTADKDGASFFCCNQEGIIYGFDKGARKFLEWNAAELGQGHAIYDIAYQHPDSLWLAFPAGQTITQVSISKKEETYRIGDYNYENRYDPLSFPEHLFLKDDLLFIANMGTKQLCVLDLHTNELTTVATFDEPIWQYAENDIGAFIATSTGIYEIVDRDFPKTPFRYSTIP